MAFSSYKIPCVVCVGGGEKNGGGDGGDTW